MVRILAVLAVLFSGFACMDIYTHKEAVRNQLKELVIWVELFRKQHGRYPHTLNELTRPQQGRRPFLDKVPLDPWGEEYVYRVREDRDGRTEFLLHSRGRDQVDGTADDLALPIR